MGKDKEKINSVSTRRSFSLQYVIKAIKDIRRSELCRSGKHNWVYYPVKKYYSQDYYKCKNCREKKIVK